MDILGEAIVLPTITDFSGKMVNLILDLGCLWDLEGIWNGSLGIGIWGLI